MTRARSLTEQDRRASVWHHQSLDGCDALQDEDVAARSHRDGAACARLQSEEGDGNSGRSEAAQSDLRAASSAVVLGRIKPCCVLTHPPE